MVNTPWKSGLATRPAILLLAVLAGCGDGGLPRIAVTGNVTIDGRALKSGFITFIPTKGSEGPKASGPISDGAYKLDKKSGPIIGKLRVEIRAGQSLAYELDNPEDFDAKAPRVLPENPIPPQFNDQSILICETKEGETNAFNFDLKTKQVDHTNHSFY